MRKWYCYLIQSEVDSSIYTGITVDMDRRLGEHNSGRGAKHTRSRRPYRLLWSCEVADRSVASVMEAGIKRLTHQGKLNFVRVHS